MASTSLAGVLLVRDLRTTDRSQARGTSFRRLLTRPMPVSCLICFQYERHASLALSIIHFIVTFPTTSLVCGFLNKFTDRTRPDGTRAQGQQLLPLHSLHLGVWLGLGDMEITSFGVFYLSFCLACYARVRIDCFTIPFFFPLINVPR